MSRESLPFWQNKIKLFRRWKVFLVSNPSEPHSIWNLWIWKMTKMRFVRSLVFFHDHQFRILFHNILLERGETCFNKISSCKCFFSSRKKAELSNQVRMELYSSWFFWGWNSKKVSFENISHQKFWQWRPWKLHPNKAKYLSYCDIFLFSQKFILSGQLFFLLSSQLNMPVISNYLWPCINIHFGT